MISGKKALVSEPKVLITGVEGAGKTLFAVQQADLLSREEGGQLYQLNIRGADPAHLPQLPFKMDEMAFNPDGSPLVDKETGDHLPKWATLPPGSVIIIDEAHKVYPQRGPGRPPKHIEMLAEGRQFGVRIIFMSQTPSGIDGFVRDRIHKHYHLERKGNLDRATIIEFDHCVTYPKTAWQERKDATVHFWAYPKEYYGWYKSAASHQFKVRIPMKIFLAILFVPMACYAAYRVYDKVGGVMSATSIKKPASLSEQVQDEVRPSKSRESEGIERTTDPAKYLANFQPVVVAMPTSAPAYQGRAVVAEPQLFCVVGGEGEDAEGNHQAHKCECFTEQMTPWELASDQCEKIARHGIYDPYKRPLNQSGEQGIAAQQGGKPEKPSLSASGVRPSTATISGQLEPKGGDHSVGSGWPAESGSLPAGVPEA